MFYYEKKPEGLSDGTSDSNGPLYSWGLHWQSFFLSALLIVFRETHTEILIISAEDSKKKSKLPWHETKPTVGQIKLLISSR
jgi:hypothetical protein